MFVGGDVSGYLCFVLLMTVLSWLKSRVVTAALYRVLTLWTLAGSAMPILARNLLTMLTLMNLRFWCTVLVLISLVTWWLVLASGCVLV